ncbi:MAG: hypothetical protein R3E89_08810 [Thiolinea sp.]
MLDNKLRLSPANIVLLTILLIISCQIVMLYLQQNQPWIGIRFSPDPASDFLRIDSVDERLVSVGDLVIGDVITRLESGDVVLPMVSFLNVKPEQISTQSKYHRYIELKDKFYQVVTSGHNITLFTIDEKQITIRPLQDSLLLDMPVFYWLIVLGGVLGAIIGTFVWSYRPESSVAFFLYIGGIGNYFFNALGAFFANLKLGYSGLLIESIMLCYMVSLHIFMLGFILVIANYPYQLLSRKWIFLMLGVSIFFICNLYFNWVSIPGHWFFAQYYLMLLVNFWCLYQQWKHSKHNPVNRSAIIVPIFSFLFVNLLILFFYVIPINLEQQPVLNGTVVHFMPVVLFVGWAIAILRYRLFEIERWWFRSWLWLLGGALVLLVDMALIWAFQTPKVYVLEISVLIAAFLYFPLRQWLAYKLLPSEKQSLQRLLPAFGASITVARNNAEFEERWQTALCQQFSPVHLEIIPTPVEVAILSDNGLHLEVPSVDECRSYRLTGKSQGTRLFNNGDARIVGALLNIARIASKVREQTILQERERIMHDLHDTVGSHLLTLAHAVPEEHRKSVLAALQTLRDTVKFSLKKNPLTLEPHLAEWRAETVEYRGIWSTAALASHERPGNALNVAQAGDRNNAVPA